MPLELFEGRIDKKGRIYLSKEIRKHHFFKNKKYRILPIVRNSMKQLEKGLLLMHLGEEFGASHFFGIHQNDRLYSLSLEDNGKISTSEAMMKQIGFYPFAYKQMIIIESCYGWELWPKPRFSRLKRSYKAYFIRILEGEVKNLPSGISIPCILPEKFIFGKESGIDEVLNFARQKRRNKKEIWMILLEKLNTARLIFGGTLAEIKEEIHRFVVERGYSYPLPFIDTEDTIEHKYVPTYPVYLSCWRMKSVFVLQAERTTKYHDESTIKVIARIGVYNEMSKSGEPIRPFDLENATLHFYFKVDDNYNPFPFNSETLQLDISKLQSLILYKKTVNIYIGDRPSMSIKMQFDMD